MKKECEHIGRYISQIYRKGGSFISKELNELGIGSGQVMFLLELYRGDGKNQEEIAESLDIDKGTTARAIKKLEEAGFLIREKDKIDKRAYKVYLSEKGKSMKDTIYNTMDRLEEERTANLTKEESETLLMLLKKVCTKI
jgi:DNA-binding MarR family transcriptional regulator